jgi:hypothetical protein
VQTTNAGKSGASFAVPALEKKAGSRGRAGQNTRGS